MRANSMRRAMQAVSLGVLGLGIGAGTLPLTGCGSFFVCQKASCPTSGTGTTGTGDYVYVSNSVSGSTFISAYQVGTGALTAVSGSPYNVGYVPVAMAVSPNDEFLYVAAAPGSTSSPGLNVYPLSTSTGAVSNGTTLDSAALVSSMAISPDGNYLFAVNATGIDLTQYTLNPSTGAVTGTITYPLTFGPVSPDCTLSAATPASALCAVSVSPQGNYVAVSLGTTGTYVFPYSSSAGGITQSSPLVSITPASSTGDYSLAFDDTGFLYVAGTGSITPYGALSTTAPTTGTSLTFASGAVPRSVTLSTGYNYLYTADEGSSQISAFSVTSGALAQLSGSPTSGPTYVSALAAERSGSYLLAAGYSSSDGLEMFPITSTGLSAAVASQATGTVTSIPVVMAATH